jgi:hypothetical protein
MNDEVVLPAAVVKKEQEPKPAAPTVKKSSKTKSAPKKAAPKKARKALKKAKRKSKKPTVKKTIRRRKFPYERVLRMWNAGKTLEKIARAVGRFQKDADDPLRAFRVALTRFHKGVRIGGKLVKLPYRISSKTLKLATKAGKKAAA